MVVHDVDGELGAVLHVLREDDVGDRGLGEGQEVQRLTPQVLHEAVSSLEETIDCPSLLASPRSS